MNNDYLLFKLEDIYRRLVKVDCEISKEYCGYDNEHKQFCRDIEYIEILIKEIITDTIK